jgi:Uma2 family endonuclease
MAQSVHHVFTFAEYVRLEADSTVRHEFFAGHLWAMAGGSPAHAATAARIIATLTAQLRDRPREVFTSDLRIRVRASGLATYPDASVVCASLELDPDDPNGHTVVNPKVVIEVLSPSTEEYDRGDKRVQYQAIPAVDEIVLVSNEARSIEVWRRAEGDWHRQETRGSGSAELASIGCRLDLAEIFRDPLGG